VRSKIAERSKHREHREAMRSKIAKRYYRSIAKRSKHREAIYRRSRSDRSIAKRCSRGIADDDAPGGVSVGAKRRSPPRASSSSDCRCPPVLYCSPHASASTFIFIYIIPFAFRPRHAMGSDMDLDAKNAPASRRRNLWPRLLDKVQELWYFFNKLVLHEDFPATMHHLR